MSTNQTHASAAAIPQNVTEYFTIRAEHFDDAAAFARTHGLAGAEVFMNDVRPRTLPLFEDRAEKDTLVERLRQAAVTRVHCSYWGSPTAFVAGTGYKELVERFGDENLVREYFGDLSGRHMFDRWCDEYQVATELGAHTYVFHLIDYQHVDGAWSFTVSRQVVLDAMVVVTQRFLRELDDRGLLNDASPVIELENAGWGLEFGAQTADDFSYVLGQVQDTYGRLRIGWDLNHLLHATGLREGRGVFLLPDSEITPEMQRIEREAQGDLGRLSHDWIWHNVGDERLIERVAGLHLSDCTPKTEEFFRNGELQGEHAVSGDRETQSEEGLRIVLAHYDNHVVTGDGVLNPALIHEVVAECAAAGGVAVLHELKNADDLWGDIARQRELLWSERLAPALP